MNTASPMLDTRRSTGPVSAGNGYDVYDVRRDFPILARTVYGKPLVYLDSAASAQKPRQVIDAMSRMMEQEYSNVHRGVHYLSAAATTRFEEARRKVQRFINAREDREIVFTRGATEAINLVAASWGRRNIRAGDEIVLTEMEHHANIVPWQLLRAETGCVLRIVPVNDRGELEMETFERLLGARTKLVAVTHMSNALGTITPIREIIRLAHEKDIPVLVDGCQAVTHLGADVQELDADFYVFSAHKLYGPTGIGVLYGKAEILDSMPPYQGGGDMINRVTFEETTFKSIPQRFEAGTPAIVEAIGLAAAIDYVTGLGLDHIAAHEQALLEYATPRLEEIKGLRLVGTAARKASILSFTMEGAHAHDIGTIVDRAGVAVRAGHHCAQPLMDRFGLAATARASIGLYNTQEDIDRLVDSLHTVQEIFG